MSVVTTPRFGPVAKLDDEYSFQQTYRKKCADTACTICGQAVARTEDMYMWYCRNGVCGAKCHIRCMCDRISEQIQNTNVRLVACPKCAKRLEPTDREDVLILAVGNLSRRFDESERAREVADRAREAADQERMVAVQERKDAARASNKMLEHQKSACSDAIRANNEMLEHQKRACVDAMRVNDEILERQKRACSDAIRANDEMLENQKREFNDAIRANSEMLENYKRSLRDSERANNEMRDYINTVKFNAMVVTAEWKKDIEQQLEDMKERDNVTTTIIRDLVARVGKST